MVRGQANVSWSKAKALCEQGRVAVDGVRALDPSMRVAADAAVTIDAFAPKLRAGPLPGDSIVHFDRDLVVVDKPPGLLSVADDEEGEDTLAQHVRTMLRRLDRGGTDAKLGVVHRLDKDTSGLMVFARNATAQRALAAAFRAHDIERVYHALAHGAVEAATLESDLVLDRGDGLRGSWGAYRRANGPAPREARHAVTYVKPLQALRGATLVECRLETGRQHQIRIHLAEAGHPLLGERVYIRDYAGAVIAAPRVMLHARRLGFVHPRGARPMSFEREPPEDFRAALAARA